MIGADNVLTAAVAGLILILTTTIIIIIININIMIMIITTITTTTTTIIATDIIRDATCSQQSQQRAVVRGSRDWIT